MRRFVVRHAIVLGFALVLASRLIYAFLLPNVVDESWPDGVSYDSIARNLISGLGYWDTTGQWPGAPPYADPSAPTARWMPGYPVFVAGVYLVFGENPRAVYAMQALLGLAIAAGLSLIAKQTVGKQIAVVAVFLYALDPLSLYLAGGLQTEQLFTFFLVAALYCFLKTSDHTASRMTFALLFGLFGGLAALTRNVAGLMFAGLSLVALAGWEKKFAALRLSQRVFLITIASVVLLCTLTPWVVRNYRLTGQYTLATMTWQVLAVGNNDQGGPYMTKAGVAAMPQTFIEQPEAEREAVYKKFVIAWIQEHPGRFLWLCVWRTIVFWSPFPYSTTGVKTLVAFSFNMLLLVFAAVYSFAYHHRNARLLPFYVAFVTFTLVYGVTLAHTRYRLPLYPLLEILAAGGLLAALHGVRRRMAGGQLETRIGPYISSRER
jgi:4-amino-4-deoxy-L-arabinose transferase-like glycosyltransferase